MKQLIVLIAMVMLGIAIAGMIGNFKSSADNISKEANGRVEKLVVNEDGIK